MWAIQKACLIFCSLLVSSFNSDFWSSLILMADNSSRMALKAAGSVWSWAMFIVAKEVERENV